MKRPAFLTAAAAALLAAATASAQTPTVEARIVPDSIGIGDTFTLEIDVERDQVQVTEFPLYENDDKLEVVQSLPVDTLSREGRRLRLRKRYVMQAFSEGRYNLGRPGVLYADKNIVDTLYTSDSLRLDVGTFQIDTAKQTIYDLKPQRTLPLRAEEITGYLFGGLFLLLNLAALVSLDAVGVLKLLGSLELEGLIERMMDGRYAPSKFALHAQTPFGHNGKRVN